MGDDYALAINEQQPPAHLRIWRAGFAWCGALVIDGDYMTVAQIKPQPDMEAAKEKLVDSVRMYLITLLQGLESCSKP
jgi:hypothetical protein